MKYYHTSFPSRLILFAITFLSIFSFELNAESSGSTDHLTSDIAIYGATPAGIMAANSAASRGHTVVLIEPTAHVGGMITSGLGGTDHCTKKVIGGLARKFFRKVGEHYKKSSPVWRVPPSVAENIFNQFLEHKNIRLILSTRITSVDSRSKAIQKVTLSDKTQLSAKIFIDATYEGDLLAKAGVTYVVGRESSTQYKERHAGVNEIVQERQAPAPVPALTKSGKPVEGLAPWPMPPLGSADRSVMAYNYRLCLTLDSKNQIPISKPQGYQREQFELLNRLFHVRPATRLSEVLLFLPVPDSKIDLNNRGPLSTDLIGGSHEYPEGSEQKREEIRRAHETYTRSLLFFLGNDPAVPLHVREAMLEHGLCADEFVDNSHWPYQLYVREARRMIGEYVLREQDLHESPEKIDSIGMGSCPVESHYTQGYANEDGIAVFEGWATMEVVPYEIPFRSILPQRSEVTNLLVPVAISASHVAFSSMRMEPVFMILGESSGVAASLAIQKQTAVQDVEYNTLQQLLLKNGQVLERRRKKPRKR